MMGNIKNGKFAIRAPRRGERRPRRTTVAFESRWVRAVPGPKASTVWDSRDNTTLATASTIRPPPQSIGDPDYDHRRLTSRAFLQPSESQAVVASHPPATPNNARPAIGESRRLSATSVGDRDRFRGT